MKGMKNMNFKQLGLSDDLINILKNTGITTPTKVQEQSISLIKEGKER